MPEISFRGLRLELSGELIFDRSSLRLSDALSGASLICRFVFALPVGIFTTSLEVSKSLSESSWKMSLSRYDFWAFFRGELRRLDVVVFVDAAGRMSSPESLPTGLSLRSRAILLSLEIYQMISSNGRVRIHNSQYSENGCGG